MNSVKVYFSTVVFGNYLYFRSTYFGESFLICSYKYTKYFYRYFYLAIDFISLLHFSLLSFLCITKSLYFLFCVLPFVVDSLVLLFCNNIIVFNIPIDLLLWPLSVWSSLA